MTMSISKVSWLHEAMIASSRRSVSWEQRAFFIFFARRLSRCSQLTERLEEARRLSRPSRKSLEI